jgi:hypothetical protein
MKKIHIILLFSSMLILSVSCQEFVDGFRNRVKTASGVKEKTVTSPVDTSKSYSGLKKTFYDQAEKILKAEVMYKNGYRNGRAVNYYKNGKTRLILNYERGLKEGPGKKFYQDGALYEEMNFVSNKKSGLIKRYHKNGKLLSEFEMLYGYYGKGMKEYNLSGKKKNVSPKLIAKGIDQVVGKGKYIVRLSLDTDKYKQIDFYIGELTDGKFVNENMSKLNMKKASTHDYEVKVPYGHSVMDQLHFVAVTKTAKKNPIVVSTTFNLP